MRPKVSLAISLWLVELGGREIFTPVHHHHVLIHCSLGFLASHHRVEVSAGEKQLRSSISSSLYSLAGFLMGRIDVVDLEAARVSQRGSPPSQTRLDGRKRRCTAASVLYSKYDTEIFNPRKIILGLPGSSPRRISGALPIYRPIKR